MEIEKEDEEENENKSPSFSVFNKITNCHSDTITSISFSSEKSNKKLLATGSNDKFIKIFEINLFGYNNLICSKIVNLNN